MVKYCRPPLQGALHGAQPEGRLGEARGRLPHLPPAPQGLPRSELSTFWGLFGLSVHQGFTCRPGVQARGGGQSSHLQP